MCGEGVSSPQFCFFAVIYCTRIPIVPAHSYWWRHRHFGLLCFVSWYQLSHRRLSYLTNANIFSSFVQVVTWVTNSYVLQPFTATLVITWILPLQFDLYFLLLTYSALKWPDIPMNLTENGTWVVFWCCVFVFVKRGHPGFSWDTALYKLTSSCNHNYRTSVHVVWNRAADKELFLLNLTKSITNGDRLHTHTHTYILRARTRTRICTYLYKDKNYEILC